MYRFRKIVGKSNFSEHFRKLINRYKRIGYSLDIMRQTACLVINPIIVGGCALLFNYTMVVRASDSMTASLNLQVVYSTDRSKAMVLVLVLLVVALWFILWGDLF